jgi:hypothetical protein
MAPKKVEAAGVTLDIPDQPPTLETDGIIEDVLAKAKNGNISGLEAVVVQCLRMPNYRCDLRESIVVDFHVELIIFASENCYGPKKTLNVLNWANDVRRALELSPNDDRAARILVRDFFVSNVEKNIRETTPVKQDDVSAEAQAAAAAAAAAPAAKGAAPPKLPPKGAAPVTKEDHGAAATVKPAENAHLSIGEIAPLAQFIARGVLQHAQLYSNAARNDRPLVAGERPRTFTFAVEHPMRPLPLSRALTAVEVEALQRDQDARAQEELERLQAEEAASLEAARLEEVARQEQEHQRQEEEKANQLYFSKAGSAPAVELVQHEVISALSQRQLDLLARVSKLEADLGLVLGK